MWKTVKLDDLYDVGSSKRVLKADWKDEGVPFYRGREITTLSANGYVDNDLFITEQHYEALLEKSGVPKADDIMITAIGTIGNTYIVQPSQKFYFKDASVLWLRKKTDVSSKYVQYWLKTDEFFSQLDKGNGATVDTLTIKKLASVVLPLPPLAEQQRIVAKLDAAFAEIDSAIKLVEAKQANADRLKASLLDVSLKGDDSLWKTLKLGDAVSIARGGSPRPIKSFITDADDGVNWIKIGDTSQGGRYIESTKEKIKPSGISRSRYVKSGDFLLSNSMSFGRPYILKTDGCIHDGWLVLSDYEQKFTADYLYYLLSSPVVQNQFEKLARGSTVRNLNTELVSSVVVSVPPLAEQQRIVINLDKGFMEIETVFATTKMALDNYTALKSSLLIRELSPSEAA